MRYILCILCFFLLSLNDIHAQEELDLFENLNVGPHSVGFTQLHLSVPSEKEPQELSISLWYPAIAYGQNLRFSDYLDYKGELNKSELLQKISSGIGGGDDLFPPDSLDLVLNAKMKAIGDAEAKNEAFPLIIWSIRYATVEYQNMLSEFITSHGYVVAFVEDVPNAPYPWQLKSTVEKANALNHQIANINASIEYLKLQPNIDENKIGLFSWSYAGESAILSQINNSNIDLVVGLSAIGFSRGIYLGSELAGKIDIEEINVPYLILFEQVAPNGNTRTLPELFNAMHPNSRYVSFSELAHGNFNVIEGMIPGILRTNKVQSWSKGGKHAQLGYEVVCRLTVAFLDATLKEEYFASFDRNSATIQENLPEGFMLISSPVKE